jgi:ornithine carbamoyltransferase
MATPSPAVIVSGKRATSTCAKWPKNSTVPIINMQCDLYHPLQAVADLMTMQEKMDNLRRKKVSIIWAYATSHKKTDIGAAFPGAALPPLWYGCLARLPRGYELPDWVIEQSRKQAAKLGGSLTITHDMDAAYEDADVVIPKNWGSWVTDPENKFG